jgi:dolichol-phosphate mannosyltransferase
MAAGTATSRRVRIAVSAQRHLYLVAPVLDESPNLPRLFEAFREIAEQHGREFSVAFILVDDGSTDGTAELAESLAAGIDLTVLRHDTNRGPGYAFGTAFEHLSTRVGESDYVATLEGDNTSRHELLRQMLRRAEEGHDAVFASPYMYGGAILHTNVVRVILSHIANTFVKEFLGVRGILTVSSFYRLYRGTCIRRLQERHGSRIVELAGFESMVEVVMKLVYGGMTISELPMVLDTSRREGKSKLKLFRTARGYVTLYRRRNAWRQAASG